MMRNNKLYKILRITFLILAIVSMTFSIFYKVGHCEEPSLGASSGGSGNSSYYPFASDVPCYVGVKMGFPNDCNISDSIIESIVADIESDNHNYYKYAANAGFDNINLMLFREYSSGSNQVSFYAFKDGYIDSFTFPSDFSQQSSFCNFRSLNNYFLRVTYDLNDNRITYVSSTNGNSTLTFYPSTSALCWYQTALYDPILGTSIYGLKENVGVTNYPVYLRDGEISFNGSVRFSTSVSSGGGGSDKQDVIDDIDDSIEDSSQLPQVDDELPADPTTPNLIKKILSALKTINKTIGGVGISIVDTLKKILGKLDILDDIKQFYQDYNNIKNTSSADVVSAFQGTIIYTTYSNIRTDISSFLNMFNVTPASSAPTWTIPLNGTVLYNQNYPNIVIDFGFYDRFRNTVSNILVAILTCSCVFNIIRSIPDIITGASGDESS